MARLVSFLVWCLCLGMAGQTAYAAEATLFRLFLLDGSVLVSYGEFARVDDRVIFSMPVGGRPDEPRLQVATVRAALVDWPRTDRYAASTRYQRYAQTRGEEDFHILSNEVALALNDIALSSNRQQALALAENVRRTVADWPRLHYGYRQTDVREIISVLDQAISTLRAAQGATTFELSLVAMAEAPALEPVVGMPNTRQQLDEIFHVASMTKGAERVAMLQSGLALLSEAGSTISDATALRRSAETQIREEMTTDRKYASLSQKVVTQAKSYASRAAISDIERLVSRVPREDAKLGNQRPEMVQAQRNTFVFNTSMTLRQQNADIVRYQQLIQSDNEIVSLRDSIKQTSAVQLQNGVITANDYLLDINAEAQARQDRNLHEVQLLLSRYNHKTTAGY